MYAGPKIVQVGSEESTGLNGAELVGDLILKAFFWLMVKCLAAIVPLSGF